MAVAHCAATTTSSFVPLSYSTSPPPKKLVLSLSSISSPFPSKPTSRKNYLRLKLLKTLTKPYPNHLLPQSSPTSNPLIPLDSPQEQIDEESEIQDFEISEKSGTSGVFSDDLGKFSTGSVIKVGLYLVGAFVFQTICAVWVFGSADSDYKDGNLDSKGKTRVLELGLNGDNEGKSSVLLNGSGNLLNVELGFEQGGIGYVGGSELEERIVEIQAMARDARESERLKSKANGLDNDGVVKTGIEKEVDSRLVKLRKRLQNSNEKLSPVFPVNFLIKDSEVEDGVDGGSLDPKDVNDPLMFNKKYQFRSPSANLRDKPKGFQGSEDRRSRSSAIEDEPIRVGSVDKDSVNLLDKEQQLGSVSLPLEEERKPSKEKSKSFQTTRKKLGKERAKTRLGKENGVAKPEPGIGNGMVRSREVGSKRAAGKVKGKQSDDKADLWWLTLPYVNAIFMRRGHDGEGPKGLFTLKTTPYTKDRGDSSHIVAFQDRGDAANFCHLLQSFFEDLGDFSANIVPLTIKELDEAVRSDNKKVVVVKKGQLKLYAGQPLDEVEMALCSLVK
ncbi:hypothetical protein HYC85_012745 [Camellia sinensis]|uniref:Uncharacterized protein n=1 Tax=Camellia sinensis TaxID=4442 RepID=A0A7J7HCS6_CAMSI|nr:hypothetical protein HYC85_012745 [Camellia sinensis]